MPSAKVLEAKKVRVEEITNLLKNSAAGVIVDYKGITVEDDTKLRAELREAGINYFVVKNSILRYAVNAAELTELSDCLEGSTAIAISAEDPIAAARILVKKSEELGDIFNVKAGYVDGKVIPIEEVVKYAKLPSKEVLIAQLLGALQSPISGLAIVLKQIAEKNEEQTA
ncbi:MAG: 50S ribosomal protein L10 [Oscillospiraceae bacterium]